MSDSVYRSRDEAAQQQPAARRPDPPALQRAPLSAHAPHLRLLPPPPLKNMVLDHPVFGVAAVGDILRRLRLADEAGDDVAASSARADLRVAMARGRTAAATLPDLDPYRKATPATVPRPLLIVVEPDPAVYRAFVESEGLSRSRVKRCSTFRVALDAKSQAQLEGRPTMLVETVIERGRR